MHRTLIYAVLVLTIFTLPSCRKRAAAAPPLPPAQPAPPPPPSPVISLTADRTAVEEGDSATLSWKTENAASVQISELGDVEPNGSAQVTPRSPTTYTATAVGPGGTASDTVRITVNARPTPPAPPEPSKPTVTIEDDFRNNIQDVYFDYDRATVRPDQVPKLEVLLGWLREHPANSIVIEGHCDERGSEEYNLGLGDSRASSARSYLANAGISGDRLRIISYGEERPICREENESCWSRNRRAHFVLSVP